MQTAGRAYLTQDALDPGSIEFVSLPGKRTWIYLWLLGIGFALPLLWLAFHEMYSILLTLLLLAAFGAASLLNRNYAILSVLLFLFLLGDVRRVVSTYLGSPALDPLLLVGSVFAAGLALPLLLNLRLKDLLSKTVLCLTVVMLLEIVNPRQGSLTVGLSGALFYVGPVLWFWIGRKYSNDSLVMTLVYRVVVLVGVLAGILGICQTYVGFLPWEAAWIEASIGAGYSALNLGGGHIRSFGFSVNSVEYGNLLMAASVFSIAALFNRRYLYVLALPILLSAQVLASQRAPLIKLLLALTMMWAVRGNDTKAWMRKLLVVVLIAVAGLAFSSSSGGGGGAAGGQKGTAAQYATNHVTQGLSHPLDAKYSTAGLHFQLFRDGIIDGIRNPLGFGLGAVTLGSGKFGGAGDGPTGSSEIDLSDAFLSSGLLGGLLYLMTLITGYGLAIRYARKGPELVGLPVLGLLTAMLGSWIPLGQYALGPLLWFLLGYLVSKVGPLEIARMSAQGRLKLQNA